MADRNRMKTRGWYVSWQNVHVFRSRAFALHSKRLMRPALKRSQIDQRLLLDTNKKSYMGHLNHLSDVTLKWPFRFSGHLGSVNIEYFSNGLSLRVPVCRDGTPRRTQCSHISLLTIQDGGRSPSWLFVSQCHSSRLMRSVLRWSQRYSCLLLDTN
jgi:hypothetical protein